jgi:hypothetical protein
MQLDLTDEETFALLNLMARSSLDPRRERKFVGLDGLDDQTGEVRAAGPGATAAGAGRRHRKSATRAGRLILGRGERGGIIPGEEIIFSRRAFSPDPDWPDLAEIQRSKRLILGHRYPCFFPGFPCVINRNYTRP